MTKVKGWPMERTGALKEVRTPCRVETGQVRIRSGGGEEVSSEKK